MAQPPSRAKEKRRRRAQADAGNHRRASLLSLSRLADTTEPLGLTLYHRRRAVSALSQAVLFLLALASVSAVVLELWRDSRSYVLVSVYAGAAVLLLAIGLLAHYVRSRFLD